MTCTCPVPLKFEPSAEQLDAERIENESALRDERGPVLVQSALPAVKFWAYPSDWAYRIDGLGWHKCEVKA